MLCREIFFCMKWFGKVSWILCLVLAVIKAVSLHVASATLPAYLPVKYRCIFSFVELWIIHSQVWLLATGAYHSPTCNSTSQSLLHILDRTGKYLLHTFTCIIVLIHLNGHHDEELDLSPMVYPMLSFLVCALCSDAVCHWFWTCLKSFSSTPQSVL